MVPYDLKPSPIFFSFKKKFRFAPRVLKVAYFGANQSRGMLLCQHVEDPIFIIERYIWYGWKAGDVPNLKYELLICFNNNILKGRKKKMALYASKIVRCVTTKYLLLRFLNYNTTG